MLRISILKSMGVFEIGNFMAIQILYGLSQNRLIPFSISLGGDMRVFLAWDQLKLKNILSDLAG